MTGTLVRWQSDTFVVQVDGEAVGLGLIVPVDSVTALDVRRERRMTLEGVGLGALAGTLLAVTASPDCVDEYGESTALMCLAYGVSSELETRIAVLGGVGALVGLIIGSETKTARWVRVGLPPTGGGGLAIGVRLSF